MCKALNYLLDNISIRFNTKFYRQNAGIPTGTNCAPLTCFYFALKEVLWLLSLLKNTLKLFKHLTQHLDNIYLFQPDLLYLKFMISWMTFDFDKVHFPFLDGDFPRSTSCVVHISQLIRFIKVSRVMGLTAPLLNVFTLHGLSMLPDKAKFVECSIISLALSF